MSQFKSRIMVVDDDVRLCSLLSTYLREQGFETATAGNQDELNRQLERLRCQLIVLDINLPGQDGLAICRQLRHRGDPIPIIMLTARSEDQDRIQGLENGADDYLTKPFNPRELVARIHAVLRRYDEMPEPLSAQPPDQLAFGPYRLDPEQRAVWRNGMRVPLSGNEFAILEALATQPRKPLSREYLALRLRKEGFQPEQRGIDMLVSRLRKRLEENPANPRYILTVWGVGYVFAPGPEGDRNGR